MKPLRGKTAVVTGAGSGIGRSVALELARRGVNVVVNDIEPGSAAAVALEVEAFGVEALGYTADVSKLDRVAALADAAYQRFRSVEILVNNAGVTLRPFRASWDTSCDDFHWLMDVNFWGVVHGHHVFVPRMRQTPGAKHIVNTSSLASLISLAGHAAYSASKSAVDGFSNAAREELKTQGIGLSILHPGLVRTRIVNSKRPRSGEETSATGGAIQWTDYAPQSGDAVIEANRLASRDSPGDPDFATSPMQYITANDVGRLVAEGILENKPHILTHPLPLAMLESRLRAIRSGEPQMRSS
jgi:NAD(P)-dependent dehydrogenase (short-subunit alcohol dehydrogenase family)